jgi:starch synthase (maltosyl-transferring)
MRAALERAAPSDRGAFEAAFAGIDAPRDDETRVSVMLSESIATLIARAPDRTEATRYVPSLRVDADRRAAQFAAWYELFPRSAGTERGRHGTFADVERRLPDVRALGFDVLYLPPIHPIGHAFRKGPNNALEAKPGDVGSPWAIGNELGGHTAIEPALGTFNDFARLVAAARANSLEIALDYALQCSPDHPWIKEHSEWYSFRPDGTIKYAENPPKKYQDIVNFNWTGAHRRALWEALRDVVLFWIERGVRTFRVDNPHTKPFAFWEWMIADVRVKHPETIFLAEAFTRPKVMNELAKLGFSQSYTYFTWRTTKAELTEYLTELSQPEMSNFYRPNFWPNTPDILSPVLQTGGRPAFLTRLVLAATLSSLYGIYSGYELCENAALPEREEYLDSEKYEIRVRDWDAPGNIKAEIAQINRIRRENAALQNWRNVTFYRADDDQIIFYGKQTQDNVLLVAVNLDPFVARDALLWFPTGDFEIDDDEPYELEELLGETRHVWRGSPHRWRLDPQLNPAAIFRLKSPK